MHVRHSVGLGQGDGVNVAANLLQRRQHVELLIGALQPVLQDNAAGIKL